MTAFLGDRPAQPSPGMGRPVAVSVIVPAYNRPDLLEQCLAALAGMVSGSTELIVVDDGSTDELEAAAVRAGARFARLPENRGPAAARNHGAELAARRDPLLRGRGRGRRAGCRRPRRVAFFAEHRDVSAVFGSYDAAPRAAGTVSQYRNLLHHFVHQQGDPRRRPSGRAAAPSAAPPSTRSAVRRGPLSAPVDRGHRARLSAAPGRPPHPRWTRACRARTSSAGPWRRSCGPT